MSSTNIPVMKNNDDHKINLKKSISLLSACALIVGTVVGSGIFMTPKDILLYSGSFSVSLLVWFISGLIALVGAICYTELGTMIQTSGGDYAYINLSYGSFYSFLYTWMMVFLTIPSFNAVSARTVADYIIKLFYSNCTDADFERNSISAKLVGVLILMFLGFVNSLNVKIVSKMQTLFTITKVITFIIVICVGIWTSIDTSTQIKETLVEWLPEEKTFDHSKLALAFYNALFAYSGWNSLNFLTEELKNPNKNLPRAVMIAIPTVIVIYMLTNISYFLVLSPQEVANSQTIAITFSDKIFGPSLSWMLPVFIAFSTFGSLSASVLGYSRVYYASARDGNLPDMFATINVKYYSPLTSTFLITILSITMLLLADFNTLILYATFTEILFIAVSISAIIYLRYKMPNAKRPFKVFIGLPYLFLVVCVFINVLTVYQSPWETLIGILFLLAGIPVYFVAIVWKNKPVQFQKAMSDLTEFCQKLFISVKED